MTKPYSIRREPRSGTYLDTDYDVVNPSGLSIASCRTWRSARAIADALNAQAEHRRLVKQERTRINEIRALQSEYAAIRSARAAVKGTP